MSLRRLCGTNRSQATTCKLHPTTVSRRIASKRQGNVLSISASAALKITITFKDRLTANSLLQDLGFASDNLRFSTLAHRLYTQAIIRNVPLDITEDLILEKLSLYSAITKVERLNRRISVDAGSSTKLVPSKTIPLTFDSQYLPEHVILFYVRYVVSVFVPSTEMCFQCFIFG